MQYSALAITDHRTQVAKQCGSSLNAVAGCLRESTCGRVSWGEEKVMKGIEGMDQGGIDGGGCNIFDGFILNVFYILRE